MSIDPLDADISTGYYTTTARVKEDAGLADQDDILGRTYAEAIKGITAYINKVCLRTTNFNPVDDDLSLAATKLTSAFILQSLKDNDKDYTDYLNLGMLLLTQFAKVDPSTLTALWGTMVVSEAKTRPTNPTADPFISLNQNW